MEVLRQRNVATRITFPIIDADGDTVTAAAALDSESTNWSDATDPGAFADLTDEAVEIGTTGIYQVSLTAAEMNFDYIYVRVQTTTTGAKTQHILINTRFAPIVDTSGQVTVGSMAAGTVTAAAIATGAIDADAIADSAIDAGAIATGAITAAKFAAGAIDAAAIGTAAIDADAIATAAITATKFGAGAIDAAAIATAAIDADAIATAAITAAKFGAGAIDAAAIATGAVDADALAADAVNEIADGLLDRNMATGTDSGSATVRTVRQALRFLRNKWSIAGTTLTVTKEDDTAASWTATLTTDATADAVTAVDPADA